MKFAVFLFILGSALIGYAASLPTYKDEKIFLERYMNMSPGQNQEFGELREEMLTPKFQVQDYGITLLAVASAVFAATRRGRLHLLTPKSPGTLIAVGIGLPILTVGGYVFDLMLAFGRGEFPHWADSMGILLMGAPVLLVLLFVWTIAHLCFMHRIDYFSTSLILACRSKQIGGCYSWRLSLLSWCFFAPRLANTGTPFQGGCGCIFISRSVQFGEQRVSDCVLELECSQVWPILGAGLHDQVLDYRTAASGRQQRGGQTVMFLQRQHDMLARPAENGQSRT